MHASACPVQRCVRPRCSLGGHEKLLTRRCTVQLPRAGFDVDGAMDPDKCLLLGIRPNCWLAGIALIPWLARLKATERLLTLNMNLSVCTAGSLPESCTNPAASSLAVVPA